MSRPVTVVEPGTVKLERLLPGPVERVWAYITEPGKRARWLAGGDFELRVGARIRLEFDNNSLSADKDAPPKYKGREKKGFGGVITRLEPMRLLAHTWTWDSGDTEVTYELCAARQGRAAHHRPYAGAGPRRDRKRHGWLGRAHRHPRGHPERRRAAPVMEDAHKARARVRRDA